MLKGFGIELEHRIKAQDLFKVALAVPFGVAVEVSYYRHQIIGAAEVVDLLAHPIGIGRIGQLHKDKICSRYRKLLDTFKLAHALLYGYLGTYADILPDSVRKAAEDIDYKSFGLDMGVIPSFKDMTWIIPIISFLLQVATTIVSQVFQKKNNVPMDGVIDRNLLELLFSDKAIGKNGTAGPGTTAGTTAPSA